ncbi:hypothetical protein C8F01DRAFT_214725 [Mycena amicta]|nr:hypothetical protein C8F01DRAFT_214669 [Mycena amicta]KAJ7059431.1 hypothetical protein C8F01DRAFT_214725 [Mycena amicta]
MELYVSFTSLLLSQILILSSILYLSESPFLHSPCFSLPFAQLLLGFSVVFDSPSREPLALGSCAPVWCSRAPLLPSESPGVPWVQVLTSPRSRTPSSRLLRSEVRPLCLRGQRSLLFWFET